MMADPKIAGTLDESAKQVNIALENLKAAQNTGDQKQILEAAFNLSQAKATYKSQLEAINGRLIP